MSKVVTLSEAASIALHSMILVGRSEKYINVDHIAEATGSSRHHIAKVMQRLAKLGYVGSVRGPGGGFYLLQNADEISLLDIYEGIEGKIVPTSCPLEKQICSLEKCFLNNITHDLTGQFRKYMDSQRLSDYIN
jgi:Rrf2 family protein